MQLKVDWTNPYRSTAGSWYKGNLHTHTAPASMCAKAGVSDMVERYIELGFDFISISDHMVYTEARGDRLVLIPGVEWNNSENGDHTGVYAVENDPLMQISRITNHHVLLRCLESAQTLMILNHPNWQLPPHYSLEKLYTAPFYHGIEIFNNVIGRLEGSTNAEDKWDSLLTANKRVLGFASDDSHSVADSGLAWIVVKAVEASADSIMEGILCGDFYCSTGVMIRSIKRDGARICLEAENAEEIQVRGEGGCLLQRVRRDSICLPLSGLKTSYVRLVARGKNGCQAWTQPFYLD